MKRNASMKIVGGIIIAATTAMTALRTWEIRGLYLLRPTMDVPESTIHLAVLSGVVDSVVGAAVAVVGIALLKGKVWARSALLLFAIAWAVMFTVGTYLKSNIFDFRLESYGFLLCLATYYVCMCYLLLTRKDSVAETTLAR